MTISHPPGGRLPLTSARAMNTFLAEEHHHTLADQVILFGEGHIGANNLPKVVTQLLPRVGFVDRKSNALPVALPGW